MIDLNGIIGVQADSPDDVSAVASLMLGALKHRGPFTRVETTDYGSGKAVALACLFHPGTVEEITRSHMTIVALNGSFYGKRYDSSSKHVLREVEHSTLRGLREVTSEVGGFSGLVARSGTLCGFRDVNGLRPLFYGRLGGKVAFASERKALWRIGLTHVQAVPPGFTINLARERIIKTRQVYFGRPRKRKITFRSASTTLQRLLFASIRRITDRTSRICVAFSGGLDSAVTAAVARNVGVDIQAVSVGLEGSSEVSTVESFGNDLGLRVRLQTFAADSIEMDVRRVLWLIEEPNLMKLSVAIPLHWAAMVAAQCGFGVMLCGQGSDELYGGYSKYAATLKKGGRRALAAQLYRSVIESHRVNYDRDDQATSPFPVELRTPFADPDLIRFSLEIPTEFKVRDGDDVTRKWILRDVAKNIGVPENIVWRRKKAIQHGTGVEKAILKLAKSRGLGVDEYLSRTFDEVRKLDSMP